MQAELKPSAKFLWQRAFYPFRGKCPFSKFSNNKQAKLRNKWYTSLNNNLSVYIRRHTMSFQGGYGGPKEMHKAVCADCKKECEVPFKPREDRPVYCRDCFSKHKK
jgi:CxxC-x17-CxxC domain-containing protein